MTDANRARRALAALCTLAFVAACTAPPGASTESAAAVATLPLASASATMPAPSESVAPIPTGAPAATLSGVPHHDPSLEALLPARIGDIDLVRMSSPGADHDYGGDICTLVCPREAREMAEAVGASLDDVAIALAYDAPVERYALVAWRIDGVSGAELRDVRLALLDPDPPFPIVDEAVVGDDVVTVLIPSVSLSPQVTQYLVAREDALIIIAYPTDTAGPGIDTTVPAEVARIIAALP